MQRWGVFSVIDHMDEIRLATELMLYDKIAVPTPIEVIANDGTRSWQEEDWRRWHDEGWEPAHLIEIIRRDDLQHLFIEAEWDLDRQKNWKVKFEEAKDDINKVNSAIQQAIDNRVVAAKAANAHLRKAELDKAIRAAAYAETKNEIISHLNRKQKVAILYGPVEFFAAYQSRAEFEALHHTEDIQKGVERVNFLIRHRLAVPDLAPDVLLKKVAELTSKPKFIERRREFYDWQINQLQVKRLDPETVVKELNQKVFDFNEAALANDQKCRWETVVYVMGIAGGAVGAWAAFDPNSLTSLVPDALRYAGLFGGLNAIGIATVRKKRLGRAEPDAPQRIAAAGAMFHQMDADTGFQFRTVPVNREVRDLPRRF
jgi:hypothetical protein